MLVLMIDGPCEGSIRDVADGCSQLAMVVPSGFPELVRVEYVIHRIALFGRTLHVGVSSGGKPDEAAWEYLTSNKAKEAAAGGR
jgi:hypothetical protein